MTPPCVLERHHVDCSQRSSVAAPPVVRTVTSGTGRNRAGLYAAAVDKVRGKLDTPEVGKPIPIRLEQLEQLPAEALAIQLLQRLPDQQPVRREHMVFEVLRDAAQKPSTTGPTVTYSDDLQHQHPTAVLAIVEAWQRLVLDGLIVNWPSKDPHYDTQGQGEIFQLTRWGRQVRAREADGQELVAARRRLGVELHPRLAPRVRDAISVGAFEQAALLALRAIEARVRDLTGDPRGKRGDRLTGTSLMQHAFAPDGGPLTDASGEAGERVGIMSLYVGAFGAVRNGLVHTEVEWTDPTEAAEYVLLADLLMRLLDRTEDRVNSAA